MDQTEPEHTPSLIDVQLAFAHWRTTRTIRRSTPAHLQSLAAGLLGQYKPSVVCQTLSVNSTALKQWAAQDSGATKSDFVALPLAVKPIPELVEHELMINLPNGVQLCTKQPYTLVELLNAATAASI